VIYADTANVDLTKYYFYLTVVQFKFVGATITKKLNKNSINKSTDIEEIQTTKTINKLLAYLLTINICFHTSL